MCNKNVNEILEVIFDQTSDENNWNTNASNAITTTGDGKLRLISDNQNTVFERSIGNIDQDNNRLRVCFDFEIFRPIGSSDNETTVVFSIYNSNELIGSAEACITEIPGSQSIKYHVDRTFNYEDLSGNIRLEISVPMGSGNYVDIEDLKISDFNFCDDELRTYFIFDQFFKTALDSRKGGVILKEWKIDGQETLTSDFFNDTNSIEIEDVSEWLYADADIDGDNRISDNDSPKTFNPFAKAWNLEFQNPVPFHGGKPTGSQNGNNYGNGILTFGIGKPVVLNADLESQEGAVFIDIDYTKNLRVVLDIILNDDDVLFVGPTYYRRYYIIWDFDLCLGEFYYEDLMSPLTVPPRVNEIQNGFLYGLTDQVNNIQTFDCDGGLNFSGNNGVFEFIVNFGSDIGQAGINYNTFGVPDKFSIIWNNQEFTSGFVGDSSFDQQLLNAGVSPSEINTGNPGTSEGSLLFDKTLAQPSTAILRVEAPFLSAEWEIDGVCPMIVADEGLEIGEGDCDNTPTIWDPIFVNTNDITNYEPANGDVIYVDAGLTTPYNGGGDIHRIRRVIPGSPLFNFVGGQFNVSSVGVLSSVQDCGGGIGNGDGTNVDVVNQDDCYSCWDIDVNVPSGESRQVQFISNFAPGGRYGAGSCNGSGTIPLNDSIFNITENTTFHLSIDAAENQPTTDQTSTINMIVRNGTSIVNQEIFQRTHGNQVC